MGMKWEGGDPRLKYKDVLAADSREVPKHIWEESRGSFENRVRPVSMYIGRDWHEREKKNLWSRVWQFACREEQIPEVGDYIIYEIAGYSYLVIRVAPDQIKAYPNACLHRGRQLKDYPGRCSVIRCPFHGIAWELDGRLKEIPAPWEFPHVDPEKFRLPEISVGTWAGFVFINPDPNAQLLHEYLGEIVEHFAKWDLENRYIEAHVSKVLRCNWKVAQEAFMECWHGAATHPQVLPYAGIGMCQVDVYEHFARLITPSEVAGPFLRWDPNVEEMLRATLDVRLDEPLPVQPKEGESARDYIVRVTRESWRKYYGDKIDEWADCELVDNFTYTVFPNMMPWGGVHKICYRFRPNGDDHQSSIMEVFLLSPFAGERPKPAQETKLGPDEPWSNASELGILANVLDQDTYNMDRMQRGLEVLARHAPGMTLAAYQEDNLKWFHALLDKYVEGE